MARVDLSPEHWMDHPAVARVTHTRMARQGILLASTDSTGKLNPMTIGWGVFGWIWGQPIFTVLVRPSRYTYGCIKTTGDFTVNVQPATRNDLADFCGRVSGRDVDKMAELDLTPLPSKHIMSPGIAECPIVFECRVVHRNDVIPGELTKAIAGTYYPAGDYHRVYFGQILAVTVEESACQDDICSGTGTD
ncbi:MAG: flavin reductase family protein [Planctomycetes bacterium]|nr:flavin reductase family protein [Planctomycetota bacterium]